MSSEKVADMNTLDALIRDGIAESVLAMPNNEIWLAIRTDGVTGDGSRENPFNASTATRFDNIMLDPALAPPKFWS